MEKVVAVVVTYNRKELLMECLDSLLSQIRPADKIILINNASTDGTADELKSRGYLENKCLELVNMEQNTGGSGGFYEGILRAMDEAPDWLWLMDDDTIPEKDALMELLKAAHAVPIEASFYASSVFGPEGEPMNVPNISERRADNGYKDWYRYLGCGCIEIADATFVSVLINAKAARWAGLPCRDYFIWGDDSEYTMRLIRCYGPAYMVGRSQVCHKRIGAKNLDIRKEDTKKRTDLYFYFYRNLLINKRIYQGRKAFLRFLLGALRTAVTALKTPLGFYKMRTVLKGISGYAKEYRKIRAYIDSQISHENTP